MSESSRALPSSESTSTTLLSGVLRRDPAAWRRFARLYGPLVYRWAREAGLQDTDAADIVQEVFHGLARTVDSYRRQRADFRGWLWGVTRHKLNDYFRRVGASPLAVGGTDIQIRLEEVSELPLDESSISSGLDVETSLIHRALELIQGDFEVRTWQAFWRTTVENHSAADIADDLNMTKRAVRQAKYRVLKRLRQELGDAES